MKGECKQEDYIKEAFDKLYGCVMPYIDLNELANADRAFKELDKKVHSEIYILKKCLAESDRAVEAGLTRSEVDRKRISELESENNAKQHVIKSFTVKVNDLEEMNSKLRTHNEGLAAACESHLKALSEATNELEQYKKSSFEVIDGKEKEINTLKKKIQDLEEENTSLRETPFDTLEALQKENSKLKTSNERLNTKCKIYWKALFEARTDVTQYKRDNIRLRAYIDALEKKIDTLKKKIQDLEEENADLHERLSSDEKSIETLEKSNGILRGDNETLYARLKERDLDISKRPWHGDANAMTCARTHHKSLVETIEELEAEKTRLEEKIDLSYGHDFKFGDEVFVPWSCYPYMYVKTGLLYNTRTKNLVYVGKDQHLKWFGDKFAIV